MFIGELENKPQSPSNAQVKGRFGFIQDEIWRLKGLYCNKPKGFERNCIVETSENERSTIQQVIRARNTFVRSKKRKEEEKVVA